MKAEKIFDRITLFAVCAVDIYYLIYLFLCLVGCDSRLMSLLSVFVISVVTLPIIFRQRLGNRLGRLFKPLKALFDVIVCVYLVTLIGFWCFIGFNSRMNAEGYALSASTMEDSGEGTLIVVFGCRTYSYGPSKTLALRLDETVKLMEALPDSICIVSGGQGLNEPMPESEAMKQYLVEHGIAEERIIEEPDSHSTSENVRLSKALSEELGLEYDRIIGVSTAFHLPRIRTLAKRYWQDIEVCAAQSPSFALYYVSMVLEYISYIKMTFFDTLTLNEFLT